MRSSFSTFLPLIAVIIMVAVSISSGCSSQDEVNNATLGEINSIEKLADNRLIAIDFTTQDEIFYSQLGASETQYKEALDKLYALGPTFYLEGYGYEARIKSLQFKIDFLDVCSELAAVDDEAEAIFQTSTPEFRTGLVEVLNDYQNIRQRILFLQVMGGDIDKNLISSDYTQAIGVIRGELDAMLESLNSNISFLEEYR
ncbi:hypothetical protein [Methanolacinia petrolearia]|uniref:hypothetical protein n=1 Tax=Methanolacinia petrolearia TaxID=54120 RepID=UPI003BA95AB7